MRDWELLVHYSPGLDAADVAVVDDEVPWPRDDVASMPRLSALLRTASLTTFAISGTDYELITWGPRDQRRGWLCHPPVPAEPVQVHETQREFWSVCGGIVERFAEPESRWSNQNEVLTAEAARTRVADVLDAYSWLWEDEDLEVPVRPDDYYAVAVEANANLTLVHRRSGQLLLFAPDHDFEDVTPFPGCPPFSLLTIDGVPDLGSWIEEAAEGWRG